MKKRESIRKFIAIVGISLCMCMTMIPSDLYAASGDAETTWSQIEKAKANANYQKITLSKIGERIKKVAIERDGVILESKDVVDQTQSFIVYDNATYTVIGYDESGNREEETKITVDAFSDVMLEETKNENEVAILSRIPDTAKIEISGADKATLKLTKADTGIYQATYTFKTNGDYIFRVYDHEGTVLKEIKKSVNAMSLS